MDTKIALFKGKTVRKILHQNEWWFVVNDVIAVLTDSSDPAQYFKRMKERDVELKKLIEEGGVQFVPPLMLEMETTGGKQKMYCWNTEGIFRIIQSIPSPKAEPFKRWLAKVGYERVQEIENPELATRRTRMLHKLKGYSDGWIEKRMRGIAVREELTDEWKQRGVKGELEYSILTAEISLATFGMTPSEYREHKALKRENLRDHMTDLELIFTMLGEASTAEIEKVKDPKTFPEHKRASKDGGKIAKNARLELEQKTKKGIISKENYLEKSESQKRMEHKKNVRKWSRVFRC